MLKEHWRIVSGISRVTDNLLIVVAFLLTYLLRDDILDLLSRMALPFEVSIWGLGPISSYLIILGIALPLFNAVLSMLGAYKSMRLTSNFRLFQQLALASGIVFLCESSLLYILKFDLSRSFLAIFCVLTCVGLFLVRMTVLKFLRYFRKRGKNFRNLLMVGTGAEMKRVCEQIAKMPELGIRIVGFVGLEDEVNELRIANAPYTSSEVVFLSEECFEDSLKKYAVDEVLFTDTLKYFEKIRELALIASEEGVTVTLSASLFGSELLKSDMSYFGDIPLIHYEATPSSAGPMIVKRLMDLFLSSAGLIVLSPLMLLIALFVKLESKGPVFFKQKRVGLNGREFVLFKFRSMIQDAESKIAELREKNEMKGPVFKLKEDPRVTKVGKFIRRYSIDELPQLINVLRGDMSLVGPRPPLPEEVKQYRRVQRRRLSMRPGMTCTWQISGRNEIPDFEDWAKLDLEYIDNWSLWSDLKLLIKTIPAVLSATGR